MSGAAEDAGGGMERDHGGRPMNRADGARSNPDPIALSAGAIRLTRSEMEAQVRLTARRLNALGIREGERVALLARNSIDWVLLAHAIPRIGATLVPINTRLTPEEIAFRLESSNAGTIVHEEGFAIPDHPILALTPEDLRAVRPSEEAIPDAPDPDRTCALLFTSGTTGRPKGVLLTWASQIASAKACAGALGTRPDDRWLVCMPLFHVGGLNILYRCSLAGARVVLHERFDAAAVNAAIDHEGVTILSVVGVMLRRILEDRAGRPFPETLRAVVAGGGAVEAELIEACPQAIATYGLTETCSMITLVPLGREGGRTVQRRASSSGDRDSDRGCGRQSPIRRRNRSDRGARAGRDERVSRRRGSSSRGMVPHRRHGIVG